MKQREIDPTRIVSFRLATALLALVTLLALGAIASPAAAQSLPGETDCLDDLDGDSDGFSDRGECSDFGTSGEYCLTDGDCTGAGATCDLTRQDNECKCLIPSTAALRCSGSGDQCFDATDCPSGESCDNGTALDNCTANDINLTFVGQGSLFDPCTGPTDTFDIALTARVSTTASIRYDVGMWVSLDSTSALTGSYCARQALTPLSLLPGTCSLTPSTMCAQDGDCAGQLNKCEWNQSGSGPYWDNESGDGQGDVCGEAIDEEDAVYDWPFQVSLSCADPDNDGLANLATCVSYDNNANQPSGDGVCKELDDLQPNNKAKCRCFPDDPTATSLTDIPVPNMDLACSCLSPVGEGFPTVCEVEVSNSLPAGSSCSPIATVAPNRRCGSAAFWQFEVDYPAGDTVSNINELGDGVCSHDAAKSCTVDADCHFCDTSTEKWCGGTSGCPGSESCDTAPTCSGGSGNTGGAAADSSGAIVWDPDDGTTGDSTNTLNVLGADESTTLYFEYTPVASTGSIAFPVNGYAGPELCVGGTNIGSACTSDSDCPSSTCEPDFSSTAALTAQCTTTLTYAAVSQFGAREDGGGVVVEWTTAAEAGTTGFELQRYDAEAGDFVAVHEGVLMSSYNLPGGRYELRDEGASPWESHTYRLVELTDQGRRQTYGPYEVQVEWQRGAPPLDGDGFRVEPQAVSDRQIDRLARSRQETLATRVPTPRSALSTTLSDFRGKPSRRRDSRAKVEVAGNGLYYLDASDLAAALAVSEKKVAQEIERRGLSIRRGSERVAWLANGDSGVYFYGEKFESRFTKRNLYWIALEDGDHMQATAGAGPVAQPVLGFFESLHFEDDLIVRPALASDPLEDYWFWRVGGAGSVMRVDDLVVPDVAEGGGDALLRVEMKGSPGGSKSVDVRLNGRALGSTSWAHGQSETVELTFAQSLLSSGANWLEVEVSSGSVLLDSVEIDYLRSYRAEGGRALLSRAGSNAVVSVDGFSSNRILVFELADPKQPVLIGATTVDQAPDSSWRASWSAGAPDVPYLAVALDAVERLAVFSDAPSDLRSTANKASYVVVTAAELEAPARAMADYREQQGLDSLVVLVEDVMDEFNEGIYDPRALKEFFVYAAERWASPPIYAVLAGASSWDYHDNLGLGGNLVPMLFAPTRHGLVPSDTAMADLRETGSLGLAIGRIPALHRQDLYDYLAKVKAYEKVDGSGWQSHVMMLADDTDSGGNFADDSADLAARLPDGLDVEQINLDAYLSLGLSADEAAAAAGAAMVDGINRGAIHVNWTGHGGLAQLAAPVVFSKTDVADLTNGARLPVVSALTCNIALFGFPGFPSLGEELVLHGAGGAAGVWGPSWLAANSDSVKLGGQSLDAFFDRKMKRAGDAVVAAVDALRSQGTARELVHLYNYLGDPAVLLKH
jgi:hypothetical protein